MDSIRKQLTLFFENDIIEEIRAKFNPLQHHLIPCHVTLCREDEIGDLANIMAKIKAINIKKPFQIKFNKVKRFDSGKGVLIPASSVNKDFHKLRSCILNVPRTYLPHITLMHPRNSTCTDVIFEEIKSYALPKLITFNKISLIEQRNGEKWELLENFLLQD